MWGHYEKEDQNQVTVPIIMYIYIYIISYTISYTIYIKRDNESAHKKGEKLDLAASDRNALFFNKLDLVRCVLV